MEPKLTELDMIELAAMRGSRVPVQEMAAHFGVHRSTIHTYLVDMGMAQRGGDWCLSGEHELTEDNTIVYKDGRRECRECKRERDREWQRQKYWAKKAAESKDLA